MATPDPLAAVSPDVAARTKAILQAVATGGSAGLKAYEQSQADLTQSKTDAVARAQQRANIIGGPEAQGFEGQAVQSYDKGIANLGTARTGFSANMAALGSAHKNYLDQVSAAVPLVRADTERQLSMMRSKIEADLEKDLAKEAAKPPKANELLGYGKALADDYNTFLGKGNRDASPFQEIDPVEATRALAAFKGMAPAEVNGILTPQATSAYRKASAPVATPDEKWITSNIRGMDTAKAKQALAAPEFVEAGQQSTNYFAIAPLDEDGNINDGSDYEGLSPQEAFRQYVYSLAGNRSMKDAAFKYYGATLSN